MAINRQQLLNELTPALEHLFGVEYKNYMEHFKRTEYHMRSSYGKYSIYRWDYNDGVKRKSTTLAKGLSKEEATGMMKLLKEQ